MSTGLSTTSSVYIPLAPSDKASGTYLEDEAIDRVGELLDERAEAWDVLDRPLDGLDDVVAEREELEERRVELLRRRFVRGRRGTRADLVDPVHLPRELARVAARELEEHRSERVG